MRIEAVAHALPERKLLNRDVIDIFRDASQPLHSPSGWQKLERHLAGFLKMAGSQSRHVASKGESPLDLAAAASRAALKQTDFTPESLELLIYASVSRGWIEPCTAVAVQQKLSAANATSFDVVDACASWLRALHVAYGLLKSGAYKNALIVSVEAGMSDFMNFEIPDIKSLERYGAASTLGNAATATLLSATKSDDFYFVFRTYPADMSLCMMPLSNFAEFMPELEREELLPDKFMANSTPLLKKTLFYLVETFRKDAHLRSLKYDIAFSHAVSSALGRVFCRAAGLPSNILFGTYAEYGNTAAASIPLGMSLALERGSLQRGRRVGLAVGSAGITVGFATFTY